MDAYLKRASRFFLACLSFAHLAAGCTVDEEFASARVARSRVDLIGGPAALANPGDYVIENDKIRAVILAPGHMVPPALHGGGLVDVDLYRTQDEFQQGRGLDQFYLVMPMVNIMVQNPEKGYVRILRDGSDGGPAAIRVVGRSDLIMGILNVLNDPLVKALGVMTDFYVASDFVLHPGKPYLQMTTTIRLFARGEDVRLENCRRTDCPAGTVCDEFFGSCLKPCQEGLCEEGTCDSASNLCIPEPLQMELLRPEDSLMDVIAGGLISGDMTYGPGVVSGDFLLFGAKVRAFCPSIGFDLDIKYRDIFLRGGNSIQSPLSFELMAGVGDRVSYAFLSLDGPVLFPFSSESLTGALTHKYRCLKSDEDDVDCDDRRFVRYDRFLLVGEGDVASLMRTAFELQGSRHGELRGQVVKAKTMEPISKADVFAFRDPCYIDMCRDRGLDPCRSFDTYAELARVLRSCSATDDDPDGNVMMVSHFRSDVGTDPHPDGDFAGPLAPGSYYLVARDDARVLSRPTSVEVHEGEVTGVVLAVPPAGTLKFRVLDQTGSPIPSRVTVGHCFPECHREGDCQSVEYCDPQVWQCLPRQGCQDNSRCDQDEECVAGQCRCQSALMAGEPRTELGEGHLSDRMARVALSESGTGELRLPPGSYDVIASRGFEYSIDTRRVEILPDQTAFFDAHISRVVDTRGWIAADSHMHGVGSPDSNVSNEDRLKSALSDCVEFLFSTDHDYIQSHVPTLRQMGIWEYVISWPGEEITTLDLSHILGAPLDYTVMQGDHGACNWVGRTPRETFEWIRENGLLGPEETLVIVPHPRGGMSSLYDQYSLNPYDLSLMQGFNQTYVPVLASENFVSDFDAQEIFNSKRFDIARTPTAGEVFDYNVERFRILEETRGFSFWEIASRLMELSEEHIRRFLKRTPEEHKAIWEYDGSTKCVMPRPCNSDEDCDEGNECSAEGFCSTPPEKPDNPCEPIKGMTDDWLRMIDHGIYKTGVGASDAHSLAYYELGVPRTYLRSRSDDPVGIDIHEIVHDYKTGKAFATYGPFVDFTIDGLGPGEVVDARGAGGRVELRLRVQSPEWFDVSRVEIYRNGYLEHVFDGDEIPVPNEAVVNLDLRIPLRIEEDSWFVVFAMGLRGRTLRPVYGSPDLPPIYISDIFSGAFAGVPIPLPETLLFFKLPVYYPTMPLAVTNPVFVDVDGEKDGCLITPPSSPLPDWACRVPENYSGRVPCGCDR